MDYEFNVGRMTLQNYLQECKDLTHPLQVVEVGKDIKDGPDYIPDASAAYLCSNLWSSEKDLIDLDSILGPCQNIQYDNNMHQNQKGKPQMAPNMHTSVLCSTGSVSQENPHHNAVNLNEVDETGQQLTIECKFSQSDLALATTPGHKHYDPSSTAFPEDELKPQPIMKKSRKNFVPDSLKDDKYWARRHKNNIAAKRSREARRVKENQIVLRASYLEKENSNLKEDVMRLKAENDMLKSRLRKFQS